MLRVRYDTIFVTFALVFQVIFWQQTRNIKPDMKIVPEVPSTKQVLALSVGDPQFYFRMLGLKLQNFGDTYGRVTPLKDYNYETLNGWFMLLDELDWRSNYIPSIAAYYYSLSQNPEDNRYIVDYLVSNARRDPETKWWWLSQAVYLANHKLKDKKLALQIAEELASSPAKDIPIWARQMPAFIHEQMGEKEAAFTIIDNILKTYKDLPESELNFMHHFIEERLKK